jgi:hypothetical protein
LYVAFGTPNIGAVIEFAAPLAAIASLSVILMIVNLSQTKNSSRSVTGEAFQKT